MTQVLTVDRTTVESTTEQAAKLLKAGEVVAVPTETVYGLAADATNSEAVQKIFEAKGRPLFNPLIIHVPRAMKSLTCLEKARIVHPDGWTAASRSAAQRLMDFFWPGPLTIVMPRGDRIASNAAGGLDTVAVRMPDHPTFLTLLEQAGVPLAAPSANLSQRISPTTAQHVLHELSGRIPLILDAGPTKVGVESTIVAITPSGRLKLLRPGGLPCEVISAKSGLGFDPSKDAQGSVIAAPGMMAEHYAPQKPLMLMAEHDTPMLAERLRHLGVRKDRSAGTNIGVLLFGVRKELPQGWSELLSPASWHVVRLSAGGDGAEAARDLFAALRQLDAADVSFILAVCPEQSQGLWPAIRDRLTRASARWS